MSSFGYEYNKVIDKLTAFNNYIVANITWVENFDGISYSEGVVFIYSTRELTTQEHDDLTVLVVAYVDPEVSLIYSNSISAPMETAFSSETGLFIEGKRVLQTFIFSLCDEPEKVIDAIKSVVEYRCFDVSDPPVDGAIDILIWDMTRDTQIANINIPLAEIQTKWDTMASEEETGSDTVFRTFMVSGIASETPNHACVWQIRGSTNSNKFDFKLNGLQTIYYNVE